MNNYNKINKNTSINTKSNSDVFNSDYTPGDFVTIIPVQETQTNSKRKYLSSKSNIDIPNKRLEFEGPKPQIIKRHASSLYNDHTKKINLEQNNIIYSLEIKNPTTFEQATNCREKDKWLKAIADELNNLYRNKVMIYVDKLPKGFSAITTKWVFTKKYDENNNIIGYKARLVARGFSQRYGIEFDITFSPTLNSDSLKLIICLASKYKWNIHQLDIKSAYLNADLDKTIYTTIPPGDPNYGKGFWRLNKALYGLRQSGRQWYQTISNFIISNGFIQLISEPCIFYKSYNNVISCLIGIYVDDMIITGTNKEIKEFINNITKKFKISKCQPIKYILGITIERDGFIYYVHQRNYIDKLLEEYNITNIKKATTPCTGDNTISENKTPFDITTYKSVLGSLIYLAKNTRPDISFAVHKAARHCENPTISDWKKIINILKYLNSTKDFKLKYDGKGELHGYSDSDFAGDIEDRKSTSGHIILFGNSPICWCSKKQNIVATSTAEAEYISISECSKKILWLRNIFLELFKRNITIKIYVDNMAAKTCIENGEINTKLKHISIKYYFNKDNILKGKIKLEYKNSNDMLADILTKNVNGTKMKLFTDKIFYKKHL